MVQGIDTVARTKGGRMKKGTNLWFKEWFTENEFHSHRLKKYLVAKKTKFQKAVIVDSMSFGRCLILDGEMQSAGLDEFIYHEALVHPAMILHPSPKNVLIMGGGEGATLREILKYKILKHAVMVDIDGEIVTFCKKYLKKWHSGSFNNRKVKVIIADARKYILETTHIFDVIISDLPSPIEGGPSYLLYTIEFYKILMKKLSNGGVFVLQAGSGNLLQIDLHSTLYSTLRKVFRYVYPYYTFVPSFDVPWAFIFCSNSIDPLGFSEKRVADLTKKRISGTLGFYDAQTHIGLFRIPLYLRELLTREKKVITEKRPVYFFK